MGVWGTESRKGMGWGGLNAGSPIGGRHGEMVDFGGVLMGMG